MRRMERGRRADRAGGHSAVLGLSSIPKAAWCWDSRAVGWQDRRAAGEWGSRMAGQWDSRIEALLSPTALGIPQGGGRIVGQKDSGTAGQWGSGVAGQQDQQGSGQRDGGTAEQHSNGTAGWQGSRTAGWQGSVIAEQWNSGRTARWQIRRTEGQWESRTAALLSPTASGIPQARGSSAQQQHLSRGSTDARRHRWSLSTYSSKLVHPPLQCMRNNNKHAVQKVNM